MRPSLAPRADLRWPEGNLHRFQLLDVPLLTTEPHVVYLRARDDLMQWTADVRYRHQHSPTKTWERNLFDLQEEAQDKRRTEGQQAPAAQDDSRTVTLPVGLPPGPDFTNPAEGGRDAFSDRWAGLAEQALTELHSIVEPTFDLQADMNRLRKGRTAPGMTAPGRRPGADARQPDPDVCARLTPGDAVVVCRELRSVFRTPPLSTARALLRLGRVDRLDELGAAGPLHAATTADARADADPELRKFEAVFARDALRVSEFIGGFFPRLRWATVHALARVQGLEHDAAREEEPGKIVHEWRDPTDPVAQRITAESGWGWPYYGAVDTTPLFIRAVTGLLDADPAAGAADIERRDGGRCALADSLAAAVDWLCRRVDDDPDGLLTYRRLNPRGIENQTWRDSWDSLSHADGGMPDRDRPVAALDVQVLAHDALAAAARHLRARGAEGARAAGALEERAHRIRSSVLERFWVENGGVGFFAAALDFSVTGARRPLRTRIGDMGHLLASGLLRGAGGDVRGRRDAVVRQLFSPGLLCAAGIRSLHADEVRYWPGGYHTGNSWLWQSMHIADGLEQHGFALLAEELRDRCLRVHLRTGLLPEFARGDDNRGVLNDRIVDVWQAADRRENRLEQPPQEVQAWTVASLYAAKRRIGARALALLPPPTPLERDVLAELPDRPEGHAFGPGAAPTG